MKCYEVFSMQPMWL